MLHIARSRLHRLPFTPQELSLVAVTAVWGSTFVVITKAMQYSGPLFFIGVRFLAAAAIAAQEIERRMAWSRTPIPEGSRIVVVQQSGSRVEVTLDAAPTDAV